MAKAEIFCQLIREDYSQKLLDASKTYCYEWELALVKPPHMQGSNFVYLQSKHPLPAKETVRLQHWVNGFIYGWNAKENS